MFKPIVFLASFILSGCAIISSPEGGEKDITPPQVMLSLPENGSTNFTATQIEIVFHEYFSLKNFSSQFFSSPPLKSKINQKVKGKKLILTLNETLKPNTTYTFNFGSSLVDITEGNAQIDYKYVFSTGQHLDSLAITGQAVDAYTGAPQKGMVALLHKHNISDSTLLNEKPLYYTITDEQGNFSIENLALDTFQLFVVEDQNLDLIYNHGAEKFGFLSYDILSTESESHKIKMFKQRTHTRLLEATQKSKGKIFLAFSKPLVDADVSVAGSALFPKHEIDFLTFDANRDTAFYWYNANQYPEDAAFLYLNIKAQDFEADSVKVLLKKQPEADLKLAISPSGKLLPNDTIILESSLPVKLFNPEFISLTRNEENLDFTFSQKDPMRFALYFNRQYGDGQTLTLLPKALQSVNNTYNDTLVIKTSVEEENNLAILYLKLNALDYEPKIMQLFDKKTGVIWAEKEFTKNIDLALKDMKPRQYAIRIIWDENKNGKWDVGDFTTRKQPERVMYYPKPIELRANWELETIWEIPL